MSKAQSKKIVYASAPAASRSPVGNDSFSKLNYKVRELDSPKNMTETNFENINEEPKVASLSESSESEVIGEFANYIPIKAITITTTDTTIPFSSYSELCPSYSVH